MRFLDITIVAGCLVATALPAMAADVATLRTALAHMPEGVLATANDPMPIAYLDVKAMSRAENGALSEGALRRLSIARFLRPVDTLMYRGKNWTEKAGVPFEDISYFVGTGMPPARLAYWGLADDKAATALFEALRSRGFKAIEAVLPMLANGEPRAINFETRDPESPWLGEIGQSSFVIRQGDVLVQASAPEDLKPALDMTRSVADNPAIAIILDGLEKAPATKDASIVQALVVTPLFGLSAVDASDLMLDGPADLEATRKKLEAKMAENAKGIPPYLAGIVTDAQLPSGPGLVISLAYADCAAAKTAVSTIEKRWNKAMGLDRIASISGQVVPAGDRACAVVMRFAAKANINQPLHDVWSGYMDRRFNVLQIGNPE